jgi:D-sedoheptulose 7-phosphate isomerase
MTRNRWQQDMERVLAESAGTVSSLDGILPELGEAIELVSKRLRAGGCLIVFGNGGSAAQAQHLAAELVGRFEQERRSIPALALTTDPSIVTAVGNDYGFEEIFARQVRALGRPGDVALAISTSGNSPNVLRALDAAHEKNVPAIGLTGRNGGKMRDKVDICLCVPSDSTPRIQEAHLVISHILCSRIETSVISGLSRE